MARRLAIIALILVAILALPLRLTDPIRNAAIRIIHPIGSYITQNNLRIRNTWLNLTSIGAVRDERNQLAARVVDLEQQVVTLENVQHENDSLQKELGVTGVTKDIPKVLGRVVIQGQNILDYTFTVDVGTAQGVRVGQPAVVQGALIGRVIEARTQSAVIRSITSTASGIQAWLSASREKGYLTGTGNGVVLSDISQGVSVPEGTVVETSGLGGTLPQGILIGTVTSLDSAQSEGSQRFRIATPIDPATVESVLILLTDAPGE